MGEGGEGGEGETANSIQTSYAVAQFCSSKVPEDIRAKGTRTWVTGIFSE